MLEAAVDVSDRIQEYGDEFAGAWVLDELERRSGRKTWLPNLRVLVTYGLIEKSRESSRRRAYYRFVTSRGEIKDALSRLPRKLGDPPGSDRKSRFTFVASGDSHEAKSDFARRSSDTPFEPPAWR